MKIHFKAQYVAQHLKSVMFYNEHDTVELEKNKIQSILDPDNNAVVLEDIVNNNYEIVVINLIDNIGSVTICKQ